MSSRHRTEQPRDRGGALTPRATVETARVATREMGVREQLPGSTTLLWVVVVTDQPQELTSEDENETSVRGWKTRAVDGESNTCVSSGESQDERERDECGEQEARAD
ncbi:hypothetical protein PC117_g13940 [Phytophthora cactorum]|uniref:Uncharacterized protein n=1 Tax=Phytophthora cactorum TaxID=29920 RepID=A0A8T1CWK4_9STRA|nr:hypothetical protein PC117_g13940 [Phytophthora cactorum]